MLEQTSLQMRPVSALKPLALACCLLGAPAVWAAPQVAAVAPYKNLTPAIQKCDSTHRYYRVLNEIADKSSVKITDRFDEDIKKYAAEAGVSWQDLKALIAVESNFNPQIISSAGALGLTQMMRPSILEGLKRIGYPNAANMEMKEAVDLFLSDPALQIRLGAHHLGWLQKHYSQGDGLKTINSYNAGHAFALRANKAGKSAIDYMLWRGETVGPANETLGYGVKIAGVLNALGVSNTWTQDALSCKLSGPYKPGPTDNETGAATVNPANAAAEAAGQPREPVSPACQFKYPLRTYYRVSSAWGMRKLPRESAPRLHAGLDIAAPSGTQVLAAMSGEIVGVTTNSAARGGMYITVFDRETKRKTNYMHLSSIGVNKNGKVLSLGDYVYEGDPLGFTGATGTTSAHLHFSTMLESEATPGENKGRHTVDPAQYTCANIYGLDLSGSDRSHRGPATTSTYQAYGGSEGWMNASMTAAGWRDGAAPMPGLPADYKGDTLDVSKDDGQALGIRNYLRGGGNDNPFMEYAGFDAGDDISYMWWLNHQITERMSAQYYADIGNASAERIWAELTFISALKMHLQAAMDEMTRRTQAAATARMSLINQRLNASHAEQLEAVARDQSGR